MINGSLIHGKKMKEEEMELLTMSLKYNFDYYILKIKLFIRVYLIINDI